MHVELKHHEQIVLTPEGNKRHPIELGYLEMRRLICTCLFLMPDLRQDISKWINAESTQLVSDLLAERAEFSKRTAPEQRQVTP